MVARPLPGLPGSTTDPGEGPAEASVLDALLDDGALTATPDDPAAGLLAHRSLALGDDRDLLAALVVPASAAATLSGALTSADAGTPVLLAAEDLDPVAALEALEAARADLWDEDRVEIVGRRFALPPDLADPDRAVTALLGALTSAVPAWIALGAGTPPAVLDVLARDGAEHVTLDVTGDPPGVAALLRALVDRDLTFRATGSRSLVHDGRAPGALNVLCAVRAALNGAEPAELAEVLGATEASPLTSAVRRMSAADGAVTRAFLVAVEVPDAATAVTDLHRLGLPPTMP